MLAKTIGWVITAVERFSAVKSFQLDHCEFGFIHPKQKDDLYTLIESLPCSFGIHFPLFRFSDTIPPSTEYALLDFNDARSEFFFKNVENDAKIAKNTGSRYLLVHQQRFFRLFSEKLAMGEKNFWQQVRKKSERLLAIQEKYGVPIILEAICGCDFLHTADQYEKFIRLFPQFSYCFDISHLQIDRWIYGIDPVTFISQLEPEISHMHLNNFKLPDNHIPFTRYNFFEYYKKSPIDLKKDDSIRCADINALLNLLLQEDTYRYYIFEQYLPDPDHPSATGIHDVIRKIRNPA